MLENIDELIELNLSLLNKSNSQTLFRQELKFLNNKRFGNNIWLAELLMGKRLIDLKKDNCYLTEFGKNIFDNGGWVKYIDSEKTKAKLLSEKQNIEFEKSKVDLDLAKKMLKEYPKTKWFARIAFAIGVLLALKELYILICK